jgi:DNA end-binding protein Ku
MVETRRVAIAKVVIRQKENLVAIRPMEGGVLGMSTMIFADEVVPADRIDDLPDDVETKKAEVDMAKMLVDSLASDFEPEKYADTYREEVLALIERKAEGKDVAVQPAREEESKPVPDLMAALKASLDAVQQGKPSGAGRKAPAKKAAAKPRAKKPPAKKAAAKR